MLAVVTILIVLLVITSAICVLLLIAYLRSRKKSKSARSSKDDGELDRFLPSDGSADELESDGDVHQKRDSKNGKTHEEYAPDRIPSGTFHMVDIEEPDRNVISGYVETTNGQSSPEYVSTDDTSSKDTMHMETGALDSSLAVVDNLSIPRGSSISLSSDTSIRKSDSEHLSVENASQISDGRKARSMENLLSAAEKFRDNVKEQPPDAVEDDGGERSSTNDVSTAPRRKSLKGGLTSGLLKQAQKFRSLSQEKMLESENPSLTFAVGALIKMSLQYLGDMRCLRGKIHCIDGLNYEAMDCPRDINFHLKFLPSKRFRITTKYRPIWDDVLLDLSFTMGPVDNSELRSNKLRVKLYGRKDKLLRKSKCYGECILRLDRIVGEEEPVEFEAKLMADPSGTISYSSDSDLN